MANEKLTWVEFKHAIALAANVSEAEATSFMTALTQLIEESLKNGDTIKIKGIGTFATKAMAERESINVATKERFIIPGYNKIVFTPESQMQEKVEKRITAPTTTALVEELKADPIQKLSQQANEITDILADLGQAPVATEQPQQTVAEPDNPAQPENPAEPETSAQPDNPAQPAEPEKRPSYTWIWVVIVLLVLALAGLFYYYAPAQQWLTSKVDAVMPAKQTTIEPETPLVVEAEPIVDTEDDVKEEPMVDTEADLATEPEKSAATPRVYTEFITTETIPHGSRLAWLSYKYYGTKELWVFIYEANRDKITAPNRVMTKQSIRIPKLDKELMDLSNPQTRQLVDELTIEYKKLNR